MNLSNVKDFCIQTKNSGDSLHYLLRNRMPYGEYAIRRIKVLTSYSCRVCYSTETTFILRIASVMIILIMEFSMSERLTWL